MDGWTEGLSRKTDNIHIMIIIIIAVTFIANISIAIFSMAWQEFPSTTCLPLTIIGRRLGKEMK